MVLAIYFGFTCLFTSFQNFLAKYTSRGLTEADLVRKIRAIGENHGPVAGKSKEGESSARQSATAEEDVDGAEEDGADAETEEQAKDKGQKRKREKKKKSKKNKHESDK